MPHDKAKTTPKVFSFTYPPTPTCVIRSEFCPKAARLVTLANRRVAAAAAALGWETGQLRADREWRDGHTAGNKVPPNGRTPQRQLVNEYVNHGRRRCLKLEKDLLEACEHQGKLMNRILNPAG